MFLDSSNGKSKETLLLTLGFIYHIFMPFFFFKAQGQSKDVKLCFGFHSLFYPYNLLHLLYIYSTLALHQKIALNNTQMAKKSILL